MQAVSASIQQATRVPVAAPCFSGSNYIVQPPEDKPPGKDFLELSRRLKDELLRENAKRLEREHAEEFRVLKTLRNKRFHFPPGEAVMGDQLLKALYILQTPLMEARERLQHYRELPLSVRLGKLARLQRPAQWGKKRCFNETQLLEAGLIARTQLNSAKMGLFMMERDCRNIVQHWDSVNSFQYSLTEDGYRLLTGMYLQEVER